MSNTPTLNSNMSGGIPEEDRYHHVDVVEAEERFNELSRQLSRQLSLQSQRTRAEPEGDLKKEKDLEKGSSADDEQEARFDLREYLSSSNDANQAAGIKHKHVGVTWEDLQVEVAGGVGHKVCDSRV